MKWKGKKRKEKEKLAYNMISHIMNLRLGICEFDSSTKGGSFGHMCGVKTRVIRTIFFKYLPSN